MKNEIERITFLLQETYGGEPWHGPSVRSALSDLTAKQASTRPLSAAHNIWELIRHMNAWREFAIHKLKGRLNGDKNGADSTFDIHTPEEDWPATNDISEAAWKKSLDKLDKTQQQLMHLLAKADDSILQDIVPGRNYPFYVLLHGLVHHDLYHVGQISLLKKSFTHPLGTRFMFS